MPHRQPAGRPPHPLSHRQPAGCSLHPLSHRQPAGCSLYLLPHGTLHTHPPLLAAQAGLAGLSESEYDAVRGGAVVFLGTLARHLDPENPKVSTN